MKTFIILSAFVAAAFSLQAADSKDSVVAAAKKLGDQNYSWTTTTKTTGPFTPGPLKGKIEKGGPAHVTGSFGDNEYEYVVKGEKGAFRGQDGWRSAEELAQDDQGPGRFVGRILKTFKSPAAEAEDLAKKAGDLKETDGAYSGELSSEAAKELLSRGRRPNSEAKGAKGTVKFWVKDGALTKYEYNLKGKVLGRDDQEVDMDRTTTVEIKEVGSTKVTLPEEAKKKLG